MKLIMIIPVINKDHTGTLIFTIFTHGSWLGQLAPGKEKSCPYCVSESVRCGKLILGRDIGWGCNCAMSWCDFDMTFGLAVVTLTFKIFSGRYRGNCNV